MGDTIRANGVEIAYRVDGPEDGPVVLLANGLTSDYMMWDAQMPALTDKYRVLRYDQRGHGGSEATKPPYSFDMLAEDAHGLLSVLGIAKVHFCGFSMGGMTALVFATKHPEMLHGLTLCDTTCRMADPGMWDGFAMAARDFGLAVLAEPTLENCFTAEFRETNPADVERVGDMIAATSLDGFVGCCNAIEEMDNEHLLAEVTVPTLVMVGAEDPMTTVDDAQRLHDGIAGSRLAVLDGAAHFSNIEQPEAFNIALRSFLDEN